jgi:hypothetical protein
VASQNATVSAPAQKTEGLSLDPELFWGCWRKLRVILGQWPVFTSFYPPGLGPEEAVAANNSLALPPPCITFPAAKHKKCF